MDSVFSFSEAERLDFLQSVLNTYGCAYICLWFYCPSSNRLMFLDGLCDVPNCLGVLDQYRGLEFDVTSDTYGVPGLAFRNHQYTFLELQQSDLLRLACTHIQRRFFQEARIKTAVFIGCGNGEIELGFSSVISQGAEIDQTDDVMKNLLAEEYSRQSHLAQLKNPSSCCLRSITSTESSPESTSLRSGNIPPAATWLLPEMLLLKQENEHEAIVKAIIHVLSSPPPPPSSNNHNNNSAFIHPQNPPITHPEAGTSAFTRYRPNSEKISSKLPSTTQQQSLLKRSFELLRGLDFMRNMRERYQASRPTSAHLLHVISERRRRGKLNQNCQALRSLLPPGTKKDKGSILTAARETLNSLMAEIEKMTKGDQKMKARELLLLTDQETKTSSASSTERLSVRVSDVGGSSSSEERFIDLQVTVRGRSYYNFQEEILIRLLEFLKGVQGVSLVSVNSNTTHRAQEGAAINEATLTLKIEGREWDEGAFREAVRRVVADLAE